MERALRIAGILTLLVAAGFLFAATIAVLQIRSDIDEISNRVDGVLNQASASLETVNRPCGAGKPCGTLAGMSALLDKGGDAIVQAQMVTRRESAVLDQTIPEFATHLQSTLGNVDAATVELPGVVKDADARINDLGRLEGNAAQLVANLDASSQATLGNINALTGDPHWRSTLANVDGITGSADKMLAISEVVEDKATHSYRYPSHNPFARTWQTVNPFLLPAAKIGAAVAVTVR